MSNHVIIGTAGHVDHGKTSLIRALTGIETDRLKQEQERGITIELGFAWFDLLDGRRAGIIDVPGHEKFVGNMLAGAAGMDVVLLVVAADEGVMPQTREHLAILELLGVGSGIVVITKTDLVEEELLELAIEEIGEALEGTFLETAPRIPVSVVSGQGLETLRGTIAEMATSAPPKPRRSFSRLPVDRVFVRKGFGTVVTGTLLDGEVKEGDQVLLMPGEIQCRIRQLQVHGNQVSQALPGQRVAINLAGIERQEIHRGMVLFKGEGLEAVDKVAARFKLLPSANPLVSNTQVRFHSGSSETLGRGVVLGADLIEPGEDGLVQFRLDEPVVAVRGDNYVIRSLSPVSTLGGGEIIEVGRRRLSRQKEEVVENLLIREQGDPWDLVLSYLNEGPRPLTRHQVISKTQLPPAQLDEALAKLAGTVVSFTADGETWYYSHREELMAKVGDILQEWHKKKPLRQGMPREELRSRVLPELSSRGFAALMEAVLPGSPLELRGQELALAQHRVELSPEQERLREKILEALTANPFSPPERGELDKLGNVAPVLQLLHQQGQIVQTGGIFFAKEAVDQAIDHVKNHFQQEQQLTLAAFRDYLSTSRKYALPLLEYLDGEGMTRRRGDVRIKGQGLRG